MTFMNKRKDLDYTVSEAFGAFDKRFEKMIERKIKEQNKKRRLAFISKVWNKLLKMKNNYGRRD